VVKRDFHLVFFPENRREIKSKNYIRFGYMKLCLKYHVFVWCEAVHRFHVLFLSAIPKLAIHSQLVRSGLCRFLENKVKKLV
jgi:hypothetical protein